METHYIARQASDAPTNLSDISSVISSFISSVNDSSTPTDTVNSASTSASDIATISLISTSSTTSPASTSTTSLSPSPLPTSSNTRSTSTTSLNEIVSTTSISSLPDSTITSTPSTTTTTTTTPNESTTSPTTSANFTTIATVVNGVSTTFTSQLPTSLVTSSPTQSDSQRTTIIAATTSAVFALIILILAAIFAYRKHTLRKAKADVQIRREGHALLDGEGFDDDVISPQMRQVNAQRQSFARSHSPTPSLLKSRITDTGSIFREEVWPPPGFVDPIAKNNSQVDLGSIVDDVMGASSSRHPDRYPSDSTDLSDLSTSRTIGSTAALGSGNHWRRSTSSLGYEDPFAVSSSQASFHPPSSYRLPPGASPPSHPGLIASAASPSYPQFSSESSSFHFSTSGSTVGPSLSASSSASIPGSAFPAALVPPPRPLSGTVPKKSSPLARALTQDQKLLSGSQPDPREAIDR